MGVGARFVGGSRGVFFVSVSRSGVFILASCFLACYSERFKVNFAKWNG